MSAHLRRAEYADGAPWRPGLPPGVYEARTRPAAPGLVRLDTAAFIGLAQRGPLNTPVPLEGWAEYGRIFGEALPGLNLPQAVHAFFAEGGRRCVVLRCMDHARSATTRLVLPGIALPGGGQARVAGRNPGAWGNRLLLRLSARRRPMPLVRQLSWERPTGGGPRIAHRSWLVPAHRGIPGTTLRLPGRRGTTAGWHLARVATAEPAGRGTARITLTPEPPPGYRRARSAAGAEEILLDLAISLGGPVLERWEEAGLHADHPRFLPRLLGRRAASEALLPPPTDGSDPETSAGSPDRIWGGAEDPTGSELLRPSAALADAWLLPDAALLAAPDGLLASGAEAAGEEAGRDAADSTRREHFLSETQVADDALAADAADRFLVFASRPAPLEALSVWDLRQPLSPAALIVFPDLLHPAPPAATPAEPAPEPDHPCFGACLPPRARTVASALPYPGLGESLADLRDAQARIVSACEAHGAHVALLDLPPRVTAGEIAAWRRALASDRAVLIAPWLRAADAREPRAAPILLPPSAAMAGLVARVEAEAHPWVSPGNRVLRSAFALADDPGLPDAGFLHEARVDVIRPAARGLMLMGGRTTSLDRDWTHLPVRRLVDWLKLQLQQDLAWTPFEPNGPVLWAAMVRTATRRLRAVFDAGGLAGRRSADAYFARCDATTTTQAARDRGEVVMLVGVAPAVPMEFLVFRLLRAGDGLSLEEATP